MKKFGILLLVLICIFFSSCSGDTPGANGERPLDSKTFSFDTNNMRTIVSTRVDIEIDRREETHYHRSLTRGYGPEMNIDGNTLLVYYDKNDQLAPLVFRNNENRYVIFAVEESYPIDNDVFAIEFNHMYVSTTEPEFMMKEKTNSLTQKDEMIPVVDHLYEFKDYQIWNSQLLVNTRTGRAAFLTPVDFSKFDSNRFGEYYYKEDNNRRLRYNLRQAYCNGDYVYLPTEIWTHGSPIKGLHRINVNDFSAAEPLVNPDYFSVDLVNAANSRVAIVNNDTLVDLNKKIPPKRVSDSSYGSTYIESGNLACQVYNLYNVENWYRIGEDFWFIGSASNVKRTFTDVKDYDWTQGYYDCYNQYRTDYVTPYTVDNDGYYKDYNYNYYTDLNKNKILSPAGQIASILRKEGRNITVYSSSELYDNSSYGRYIRIDSTYIDGIPSYSIQDSSYNNAIAAVKIEIDDFLNVHTGEAYVVDLGSVVSSINESKLINILPSEKSGVTNIYYCVKTNDDTCHFCILELNAGENGSLTIKKNPAAVKNCALPSFSYRYVKNYYWNVENKSMVWGDAGHSVYWLDKATQQIYGLNLDTGAYAFTYAGGEFAEEVLTRTGDNLIYVIYKNGTDCETYSIDCRDINGKKKLISSNNMAMIPLLELEASYL